MLQRPTGRLVSAHLELCVNTVLMVAVSVLVSPLVSRYLNFIPTSSFSFPL